MSNPTDSFGHPVERRRHRRISSEQVDVSVPHVTSVEVLDISAGGALLSTGASLEVGHRAQLRTLLAGEPFTAWVQVERVGEGTFSGDGLRHRLGVTFSSLDDNGRKLLQRFAKNRPV